MNFKTSYYIFISFLFAFALYIFQSEIAHAGIPPVIQCPPDMNIECPNPTSPQDIGEATCQDTNPQITFDDNGDGEVPPCPSIIERTWTCTDASGEQTACQQTITVNDTTPPNITIPPDVTVECGDPTDPTDTGEATCSDDCDPSPTPTFVDAVSGDCPQTITRTWTCTDACGNSATATQTITLMMPPPDGCCVLPDLSCSILAEEECSGQGGVYQGDDTQCSSEICADHYKCYDVLWMSGRSAHSLFFPPRVLLEDQFESEEAKILAADTFCNPVNKNGEGIFDPTAHLTCYNIRRPFFSFFSPSPVRHVQVVNQFGEQDFVVGPARNLCVPTEKNYISSDLNINHYKCYDIVDFDDFLFPLEADLVDQFEEKRTVLLTPKRFCNPVSKDDGHGVTPIVDPDAHLTCYDISDERLRFISVRVSNQIDELLKLLLGKPEFLCVPSGKFEN
ncbi:MAG: hypothetical protein WBD99_10265 [Thermodesulfobacteriota bacterium]